MKSCEEIRIPKDFKETQECVMSNCDGIIDKEVVQAIKGEKLWSSYTGWEFFGRIWWNKNLSKWCCEVWEYGIFVETFIEDELKEIMSNVSFKYGYE